jgi:hypothetical protein
MKFCFNIYCIGKYPDVIWGEKYVEVGEKGGKRKRKRKKGGKKKRKREVKGLNKCKIGKN